MPFFNAFLFITTRATIALPSRAPACAWTFNKMLNTIQSYLKRRMSNYIIPCLGCVFAAFRYFLYPSHGNS